MMWHKWTKKSFIDVMKLGCAILLTAAPWIFGLDGENIAKWNGWLNTTKPPHPAKAGIRCVEANSKRNLVEISGTAATIMSGLFRHPIRWLLHDHYTRPESRRPPP